MLFNDETSNDWTNAEWWSSWIEDSFESDLRSLCEREREKDEKNDERKDELTFQVMIENHVHFYSRNSLNWKWSLLVEMKEHSVARVNIQISMVRWKPSDWNVFVCLIYDQSMISFHSARELTAYFFESLIRDSVDGIAEVRKNGVWLIESGNGVS